MIKEVSTRYEAVVEVEEEAEQAVNQILYFQVTDSSFYMTKEKANVNNNEKRENQFSGSIMLSNTFFYLKLYIVSQVQITSKFNLKSCWVIENIKMAGLLRSPKIINYVLGRILLVKILKKVRKRIKTKLYDFYHKKE